MAERENGHYQPTAEENRAFSRWMRKMQDDYLWYLGQLPLRERFAGQFVVMHERTVIGSGATAPEALADAQLSLKSAGRAMPPRQELWVFISPSHLGEDSSSDLVEEGAVVESGEA